LVFWDLEEASHYLILLVRWEYCTIHTYSHIFTLWFALIKHGPPNKRVWVKIRYPKIMDG
jgi:hypothetical protein